MNIGIKIARIEFLKKSLFHCNHKTAGVSTSGEVEGSHRSQ